MDDRETKDDMLQTTHAQRPQAGSPDLGANTAIGKRLKAYYDDVASEPVPDRFLSLLDALDKAESASKTSDRE
jgi:hypothetical protein